MIQTPTQQVVNLFTLWAKPRSNYLIALLNPAEMTANHFWSDSITFGSSTKMFVAPEVCYSVFLCICVWRDTAWNKEPRRLKLVWRYAHSEFTWNTAPMAPGNSPHWLIPHWDSLTLSGVESELCEWQYTQVVTRPYPITQSPTLFTFVRTVRPLIRNNHIYT